MRKKLVYLSLALTTFLGTGIPASAQESELERRRAEIEMKLEQFENDWEIQKSEQGEYFDEDQYKAERKFLKREVDLDF